MDLNLSKSELFFVSVFDEVKNEDELSVGEWKLFLKSN